MDQLEGKNNWYRLVRVFSDVVLPFMKQEYENVLKTHFNGNFFEYNDFRLKCYHLEKNEKKYSGKMAAYKVERKEKDVSWYFEFFYPLTEGPNDDNKNFIEEKKSAIKGLKDIRNHIWHHGLTSYAQTDFESKKKSIISHMVVFDKKSGKKIAKSCNMEISKSELIVTIYCANLANQMEDLLAARDSNSVDVKKMDEIVCFICYLGFLFGISKPKPFTKLLLDWFENVMHDRFLCPRYNASYWDNAIDHGLLAHYRYVMLSVLPNGEGMIEFFRTLNLPKTRMALTTFIGVDGTAEQGFDYMVDMCKKYNVRLPYSSIPDFRKLFDTKSKLWK